MAPQAVCNGHTNGEKVSDYEKMGNDLLQNMKIYEGCLRMEGRETPSLSPSSLQNFESNGFPGEAARIKIVELAQRILASTMDPRMNLLISSLQVSWCLFPCDKILQLS
jgi:hypothetical protein